MAHPAIYGLSARHELATRTIEGYAARQPKGDLATGIVGKMLPGGGMVRAIATLALQVADLYQPLARDLAVIYEVRVEALAQERLVADERSAQIGAALSAELSAEYLRGLLQELVPDLWKSAAIGTAAGAVPVVGRFLTGGSDGVLTATLAWRLGTMAALYLLYGERWLGSKENTYALAKSLVGKPNGQIRGRVRLQDIPYRVPEIYWHLVDSLVADIRALRRADPSITEERLRALLQRGGAPDDQIEVALREN
jgi:hypothetical protein